MNTATISSKASPSTYAETLFSYVAQGGKFLALCTDSVFVDLLKATLHRHLGLQRNAFLMFSSFDALSAFLTKDPQAQYVICLERQTTGITTAQAMDKILGTCPLACIIVVTQEVDQFITALLVEQGAHNIITKPISMTSLTEKLAFTVAPQGQLNKLIEKGKKLLDDQAWGEALSTGDDILELKQGSAVGYMIKGDAYKGLNMLAKAEDMYVHATKSADLYLAPLKQLAELYALSGDTTKQLECLKKLHTISPLNTQRILQIGELEITAGNTHAAEAMFEQAMSMAKREAMDIISNLSSRIADICADDNPDMAARYSKKALDMKGNHFTVDDIATVNILGISLRKQGKWKEAIREYRRVIEVIPNHAGLLYNMALAYSEGGLFAQALTCLQQALALDPSLPDSGKNIAYNVGKIFEKSGQSGTVFFKKAYALDPNDTTIWEALKRSQAQDSAHEQRTEMAQS